MAKVASGRTEERISLFVAIGVVEVDKESKCGETSLSRCDGISRLDEVLELQKGDGLRSRGNVDASRSTSRGSVGFHEEIEGEAVKIEVVGRLGWSTQSSQIE